MTTPFYIGQRISSHDWHVIRRRAMFECCKWDVQSFDHSVLADFPLFLQRSAWNELCQLAQGLAAETKAAESELLRRPDLHEALALPKRMIRELAKRELGQATGDRVMRFDFHFTDDGWKISEVNADVPGGFVEGSGFTKLMAEHFGTDGPSGTADAYVAALVTSAASTGAIAMVHATAYSDDRQVMEYVGKLISRHGRKAVPVSPEHLKWQDGIAQICTRFAEEQVAAIVRFFPADWLSQLEDWTAFLDGKGIPISNPASSLLVQSKAFPLVWNGLDCDLQFWRKLLPKTVSLNELKPEDETWVLKPVFGRVGEDIGIVGITPPKDMNRIYREAKRDPRNWIAQKRFAPVPVSSEQGDMYPCIGVYTVNGRAVGAYARISGKPLTDDEAQDVAILFEENR